MRTNNFLRSPDGAEGGGAATADVAALERENAELKEQLAAVKKPGGLTPEQEKFVRERVKAGLTREQAISVLQAQEEWDASPLNTADEPPKPRKARSNQ